MKHMVSSVKQKLDESVSQLCAVSWMFSKKPGVYFSRERKLPFRKMISTILSMEGGCLATEMLKHFGCSAEIASSSAFVQQRGKLSEETFPMLFRLFINNTDRPKLYKGLRIFAADGSDIQIPTNPNHPDSFFPGVNGQAPYSLLHLDAMYDLLQNTYMDAILLGQRKANERNSLCQMVDRSTLRDVLVIADRGYEGYNLMAHIQEKKWNFLIRIQDISSLSGIAAGFDLPNAEEFDFSVDLSLTTKQSNEVKTLLKIKNQYKCIASDKTFDYLPKKNRKHQPAVFYNLPFRIVRFKITGDAYETVVTNLDKYKFPAEELKKLYNMRWGIETSFRQLKYTIGLSLFQSKKVEYITQEIFARLTMYNFCELITSHVVIQKKRRKYVYQTNFTAAVHICRQFLRGDIAPPKVADLISSNLVPIRPGRYTPRRAKNIKFNGFFYRIA